LRRLDSQLFFVADGSPVSLPEPLAVQFDFTFRHLEPGMALRPQRVPDFLARREQSHEQLCILMNLYRAVGAVARCDQPEPSALLGLRKTLLLIPGLN